MTKVELYLKSSIAKIMSQDLGLAQDAATRTKAATPLGSVAHQVFC